MTGSDEARRFRIHEDVLAQDVKRTLIDPFIGAPSLLVSTVKLSSYPTVSQAYFACQPLTLLGAEVEGAGGMITASSSPFFALNLGSAVPPVGTQVVVTFVGNRWVFRYDA